jgi:hypothetical protein
MPSNLDLVRRWYAERDPELLDPHVEWRVLDSFPAGGIYRGRESVLGGFFPALAAEFAEFAAEPETFLDAGDAIVTLGRYRGRAKHGTTAIVNPFAHVWRLKDGRIVAFDQFADTARMAADLQQG